MEPSSCKTKLRSTNIMDLELDALVHCASFLNLQDLSNMAMACKFFKRAAYSDSIWNRWFREQWPQVSSSSAITSGVRAAYLSRHTAVQQFKFVDPRAFQYYSSAKPCSHILLDKDDMFLAQGSEVQKINTKFDTFQRSTFQSGSSQSVSGDMLTLSDHNARITCMRLFSLNETSLFRSEAQNKDKFLVTSSCDHSIRLWWKGCCQRCLRGHNGPVTTLSDKLLGDCSDKVLASGGEDGTVRLWSLTSSGKRGQRALRTTFHGHEKPISLLSVAGHKTSLLVSISKDAKVRVWDTTLSSAGRSASCVGMTSVLGSPVGLKCHESLFYIAAGSAVTAIDLRTMRKVFTAAIHQPKLYSFEMLPSKSFVCTGGNGKVMVWDIRKSQEKPEPMAELDGHVGRVSLLHIDPYKIVSGGPEDFYVKVWETDTGVQTNSLECCFSDESGSGIGCSAMAVDGSRMVTASCGAEPGSACFMDFSSATQPIASKEDSISSKFWESELHSGYFND
ncbi:hypothetical protein NE237_021067 [Protea cynaroides]|uniref:Uncharacterized protein n=1 Tax=Protea cynaroides TaxID=273540 RepID=A0A9Q0K364_9MAGN|nr:hypothetical protein NE237_021067 [Protea cynaroides]